MDERKEELNTAAALLQESPAPEAENAAAEEETPTAEAENAAAEEKTAISAEEAEKLISKAPAAPSSEVVIPVRARREKKRRRWLWILLPAVLLLLLGGAAVGYYVFLRVPAAEQIVIREPKLSLREGDGYLISYELYPVGADRALVWESSNPKVAEVDETGKVTAIAAGTVTVTGKAKSGAKGTCFITVRPPITEEEREILGTWSLFVTSQDGHIDYYYGSAYTLTFYSDKTGILTENGEEAEITWEFDEVIDGYNYYDIRIPSHRGATLKLNSNTGDGMSGSLTLVLSDTLLWVFMKNK